MLAQLSSNCIRIKWNTNNNEVQWIKNRIFCRNTYYYMCEVHTPQSVKKFRGGSKSKGWTVIILFYKLQEQECLTQGSFPLVQVKLITHFNLESSERRKYRKEKQVGSLVFRLYEMRSCLTVCLFYERKDLDMNIKK